MSDATQQLIDLQDTDRRIRKLLEIIDSVPQEKEKIKQELSGAEAGVAAAKEAHQAVELKVKSIEMEISTCRERMRHLQGQSAAVKKNEEYRALLSEIDGCKQQISDLEDQELVLWEEREGLSAGLTEANELLKAAEKRIAAAMDDLDVRERNAGSQLEKLQQQREAQVGEIEPEVLAPYDRLVEIARKRGQSRDCLVPLTGNSCGGCHMSITTQVQTHVRGGKVVPCEQCGALLYFQRGA